MTPTVAKYIKGHKDFSGMTWCDSFMQHFPECWDGAKFIGSTYTEWNFPHEDAYNVYAATKDKTHAALWKICERRVNGNDGEILAYSPEDDPNPHPLLYTFIIPTEKKNKLLLLI